MDNTRLFLFIALSFIGMMIWEAWQRDYHQLPITDATPQSVSSDTALVDNAVPTVNTTADNSVDDTPRVQDPTNINAAEALSSDSASFITVTTDVFIANISLRGGGISFAALTSYPVDSKTPDIPCPLERVEN